MPIPGSPPQPTKEESACMGTSVCDLLSVWSLPPKFMFGAAPCSIPWGYRGWKCHDIMCSVVLEQEAESEPELVAKVAISQSMSRHMHGEYTWAVTTCNVLCTFQVKKLVEAFSVNCSSS